MMYMQVIKRRQNKTLAARIVAETIRAQALVMDRKGTVSQCFISETVVCKK